ncbi:hypothetical protein [Clostridium luticellarii]|uniref:Uncharacterized protein n=1 Tax=Clostridium luticellarii TaxID=1691940 RepID=A0A2T0BLK5_9CLOT|nr:hypothetical protein [Clostridium luticellarii]PRR84761.1 hypothetical protein CLLU_23000 [Clostridium luticellarii]
MSESDENKIACTKRCSTCGKTREQRAKCTKDFMINHCKKCKNRETKLMCSCRCMDNICVYALG